MKNYVWQFECGWGVFCAESDALLGWAETHGEASKISEFLSAWEGPTREQLIDCAVDCYVAAIFR